MDKKTVENNALAGCLKIFFTFFRVGLFTFGGGYAMLPIVKREVVENHRWLSEEEFIDMLAVAQSLPGAVAVNSAVYVGYKLEGLAGSVSSLLGVVLPSFLVILVIAVFFIHFATYPLVTAAFAGIRPTIVALIAAAVFKIGKPVLKKRQNLPLVAAFLLLSSWLGLHPMLVILCGVATGIIIFSFELREEKKDAASD